MHRVLVTVGAGGPGADTWRVEVTCTCPVPLHLVHGMRGLPVAVDRLVPAAPADCRGAPRGEAGAVPVSVPHLLPAVPRDRWKDVHGDHADLCVGDESGEAVARLLQDLAAGVTDDAPARRYGRWLFECLLAPAWPQIRRHVVDLGAGLEIALCWPQDARDLHRPVWEAMWCPDGQALAGRSDLLVAVTRVVQGSVTGAGPVPGTPRVLFASAGLLSDPALQPGTLFMGLLQVLERTWHCHPRTVEQVSVQDLRTLTETFRPDVVQLIAHGDLDGDGHAVLRLAAAAGEDPDTTAAQLVAALTGGGHRPGAVMLAACHTGDGTVPMAAELVAAGIPVVAAMSGAVSEPACRLFIRRLAKGLYRGRSIVEAAAHGRRAALIGSQDPPGSLDWALSTLYLSEDVDPARPVVSPPPAAGVTDVGHRLQLLPEPVFVGRDEALRTADTLGDQIVSVLGLIAEGDTCGLGGTRLLQEIGWRALRRGHLPVFLGPYDHRNSPNTLADLVAEILNKADIALAELGLPPVVPRTLQLANFALARSPEQEAFTARFREQLETVTDKLTADPYSETARSDLRQLLTRWHEVADAVTPDELRGVLAGDLQEIARISRERPDVFGPGSRVLLLCDNVHLWGVTGADGTTRPATLNYQLGALGGLLHLMRSSGLGKEQTVPVVLTAARSREVDPALIDWNGWKQGWTTELTLGLLTDQERAIGYQWILLHPQSNIRVPGGHGYGRPPVYAAAPGHPETLARDFQRLLEGRPKDDVTNRIYLLAASHADGKRCTENDDEATWDRYSRMHLEGL